MPSPSGIKTIAKTGKYTIYGYANFRILFYHSVFDYFLHNQAAQVQIDNLRLDFFILFGSRLYRRTFSLVNIYSVMFRARTTSGYNRPKLYFGMSGRS
jgi:hypothetical protein